jgi:tripartite-type tricarboxylate transporter receptor subunit TctC
MGRDRSEMMPNVPTVFEAMNVDDEGAWWLDFRDDVRKLGRLLVTTPNTPPDRLAYLRRVVKEIETDPQVMKYFEDKGNPLTFGEPDEMAAIIARLLGGSISEQRLKEIDYVITQKYYGG